MLSGCLRNLCELIKILFSTLKEEEHLEIVIFTTTTKNNRYVVHFGKFSTSWIFSPKLYIETSYPVSARASVRSFLISNKPEDDYWVAGITTAVSRHEGAGSNQLPGRCQPRNSPDVDAGATFGCTVCQFSHGK